MENLCSNFVPKFTYTHFTPLIRANFSKNTFFEKPRRVLDRCAVKNPNAKQRRSRLLHLARRRDKLKTGNSISYRNTASLISLVILAASLLNDKSSLEQDTWIALIFAGIIITPVYLIYARTLKLFPEKGFFDIIELLFGKFIGTILTSLMLIYGLWVCSITLFNFSEYTSLISLENTPKIVIILTMLSVAVYLACAGINVLGRWSLIMIASLIFNLIITFILASRSLNPDYLKPVFNHSIGQIAVSSLKIGTGAFSDVVLVMSLFAAFKKGDSTYKAYMYGLISGALFLILLYLRNIMILSPGMVEAAVYPSYTANRVIYIGSFLEHVESLTSFNLMLLGITKTALCLSAASISAAKIFKLKRHAFTIIASALLALIVSRSVFGTTEQIITILRVYLPWSTPFFIIIPIAVWIAAEVRVRKNSASLSSPAG